MKKIRLVFLIALSILLFAGCSAKLEVPATDIEAAKSVKISELVNVPEKQKDKIEILNLEAQEDFTVLGKKEVTYKIKDKASGKEEEVVVKFNVVDTTGPEIKTGNEIKTDKGSELSIVDSIKAVDIVDGEISADSITYTGDININKVGKYPITVKAKDKSGNETSADINVVVSEPLTLDKAVKMLNKDWSMRVRKGDYRGLYLASFFKINGKAHMSLGIMNSSFGVTSMIKDVKLKDDILTMNLDISSQYLEDVQNYDDIKYDKRGFVKIDISNIDKNEIKIVELKGFDLKTDMPFTGLYKVYSNSSNEKFLR